MNRTESPLNVVTAIEERLDDRVSSLERIWTAVESPTDFTLADTLMLYALTLQFAPDHIVEVGRQYGNSTCAFIEAAHRLGCEVTSVDLTDTSWRRTESRVREMLGDTWLQPLTLINRDVTAIAAERLVPPHAKRPLFFWDVHGTGVADYILHRVFPLMAGHVNLVIVHDMTDLRAISGIDPALIVRGTFASPFEELPMLHEFLESSHVEPSSAAHDVARVERQYPERWKGTEAKLPSSAIPVLPAGGHWMYFSVPANGTALRRG